MSAEDSKGRSIRPEQTVDGPSSSSSAIFSNQPVPVGSGAHGSGVRQPTARDVDTESWIGDRYKLVRLLGKGGHGQVYEAVHAHLDRRYALKLLGAPDEERGTKGRFEREAKLLSLLNHENIVGVVDAGVDAVRGQYLVLELVAGRTLADHLETGITISTPLLISLVEQIARGLHHAHQLKIVHRDLKPENIMLSPQPNGGFLVKILDFGIAKLTEPGPEAITRSGWSLGTAAYMAPEQARGSRDLDERVDVFAFGVVVYEVLAGKRPFDGASYNEILFRVVSQAHSSILEHRPELSREVAAVLDRALAKDRQFRYASVALFAEALTGALRRNPHDMAFAGGRSSAANPNGETLLSTDVAPVSSVPTPNVAPIKRWKLAAVGALVLVPFVAWWTTTQPASSSTTVGPEDTAADPAATRSAPFVGAATSISNDRNTQQLVPSSATSGSEAPTTTVASTSRKDDIAPKSEAASKVEKALRPAPKVVRTEMNKTPPAAQKDSSRVATPAGTEKPVSHPQRKVAPAPTPRPGYVLDSPY